MILFRVLYGCPSVHVAFFSIGSGFVLFLESKNLALRFGAVFGYCKFYGAVRGGFEKTAILRCGSVRVSNTVNLTVRFGAEVNPTVLFSASSCDILYGADRLGFQRS